MKITKIESFYDDHLCAVRVTTQDGMTGWGQTAHNHTLITNGILHDMLAPLVLGMDSDDVEEINDKCIRETYKFYGMFINRAASGIDTALWDMRAKRKGMSVAKLLGAKKTQVDIYASSMDKTISAQQEADRMARLRDEYGFRAFKLHIASGNGQNGDMYPGRTEEVVQKVRSAIGDETELYVDPNGAYTPDYAIELAKNVFEPAKISFFEEPCPFWRYEDSASVAACVHMPVAGGEQDFCLAQWERIIRSRVLSIAQPDICYIGGLTRALRVADMTEKAGLACTPHNGTFNLLQVFSIHFAAAISNPYPFNEFSIDQDHLDPWTKNYFFPQFDIRDGKVKVPDEPGWGVTISPEWLERVNYQVSNLNG